MAKKLIGVDLGGLYGLTFWMMVHTLCQTSLTQLITTLIYTKCLETNLLESEWELPEQLTVKRELLLVPIT